MDGWDIWSDGVFCIMTRKILLWDMMLFWTEGMLSMGFSARLHEEALAYRCCFPPLRSGGMGLLDFNGCSQCHSA